MCPDVQRLLADIARGERRYAALRSEDATQQLYKVYSTVPEKDHVFTINGMGERAGNCDLGETALALRCLYGVPVEINLAKLRETSETVQRLSGYQMEPWKPAVGNNLFNRESGAVASQFHIPEAIEPYAADLVGATRSIVLGKKSGLDSIDLKCRELKLEITPEQRAPLLAEVKKRSIAKRGLVNDDEFREIYRAVLRKKEAVGS